MGVHISKYTIHQHCLQTIKAKISVCKNTADEAQASANAETKSTAGDKHDTARAMAHLEQEKYAKIVNDQIEIEKILVKIDSSKAHCQVRLGSLTKTSQGWFYIAAGIGKCIIEETEIFVLSSQAPIAQLLIGKSAGDTYSINGKEHIVQAVY